MELFLQKFFSIAFMVFIGLGLFLFVTAILRHLLIDKMIRELTLLSDEKRREIIDLYRAMLPINGVALRIILFGFILFLILIVLSYVRPDIAVEIYPVIRLMGIILIIGFVHFVEDLCYKKKILKALE